MPSPGKRKLSPVNASKGGSSTGNASVPIGGQKKEEEKEGVTKKRRVSCQHAYKVSDLSIKKIVSGRYAVSEGSEVIFELEPNCKVSDQTKIQHAVVAKLHLEEENATKIFLIDIDGTICDDIKNEESHLYPGAKVFPNSREVINKWYNEGNIITFFTAREAKDRRVTEEWLEANGFKYHGLVMDKPRIKDGQEYVWIDNRKVRVRVQSQG